MAGDWTIKDCLRSLEAKFGSRVKLAEELGIGADTITTWHRKNSIPSPYIIPIKKLSENKFSYEELLGANEDSAS